MVVAVGAIVPRLPACEFSEAMSRVKYTVGEKEHKIRQAGRQAGSTGRQRTKSFLGLWLP